MVKAEHLTKYYGDVLALNDVSFEFGENKVYGFLGPNGAGKSTTMNIMTGCLSATEGKVTIDGFDIYEEPQKAKSLIGYLPEFPPLYVNETPDEYLRFVGEAKGIKGPKFKEEIEYVVERTGIAEVRGRLISSLSKGFRQRVGIAQALLGDPHVVILDEPTVGLDPLQIIEIRELIKRLGDTHTVILSSHILSEVQMICEEVLIISAGKVAAFGTPTELETLMSASGELKLTARTDEKEAAEIIRGANSHLTDITIKDAGKGMSEITINIGNADAQEIQKELFLAFTNAGKDILEMSQGKTNLEDVFIGLTEGNAQEGLESADASTSKESDAGGDTQ